MKSLSKGMNNMKYEEIEQENEEYKELGKRMKNMKYEEFEQENEKYKEIEQENEE